MKKLLLLCWVALFPASLWGTPNVVVSIQPFYHLTTAVMDGVGKPTLLVPSNVSPHQYALTPSQRQSLAKADVIVWVGPELETFLTKTIKQQKAQIMTIAELPGIIRLPIREGAEWASHPHHGHSENSIHTHIDAHLWLDPMNAITFTQLLSKKLAELDPDHAIQYQENADLAISRLENQMEALQTALKPLRKQSFMVLHDAYQYFEKRFDLHPVGSVLIQPDVPLSAARVLEIQQTLKKYEVQCIFTEPQFTPSVVEKLVKGTSIGTGMLDPIGPSKPAGLDGYMILLDNLAKDMLSCLERGE